MTDWPILDAEYLANRQLQYLSQTAKAKLTYCRDSMLNYIPPPTRRKPADIGKAMYDLVDTYNIDDGIPQPNDNAVEQECVYEDHQVTIAVCSDTDLGGTD